ncbi:MAG TPA: endopeptidase La [Steroidobacteraceae bacterium]|nr:endopeptidase La [Steroidobacteraceae bacterium]
MADAPEDILILPVRGLVVFPGTVVPIAVGRPRSVAAAQEAMKSKQRLGVLMQRDVAEAEPAPEQLHQVGTVATIVRYVTAADGGHHLIVRGEQRFRVEEFLQTDPYLRARVVFHTDEETAEREIEARARYLRERAIEAIELLAQVPPEIVGAIQSVEQPGALADLVASLMDLKPAEKQQILEMFPLKERLDRVIAVLSQRIEVLRISKEIGDKTREALNDRQKEAVLREQLRQIRHELGETEGGSAQVEELTRAIEQAGMPPDVSEHATKELRRLERMPEASPEYSMVATYLEWLAALPWSKMDAESFDMQRARQVLDEDHFDLDKIKRRIIEFLAVRKLNPQGRSPILCFVGPPGVGKTSLGQSIARALGIKFARVSLGGVHDEAEIRGHRRTYIGALPGNIIQALRKAGTRNPVLMLDEIDKLSASFQGDPYSALLEVLDPEQNNTFRDNYLAVPFDLSRVLFICTANVLDTVPPPARDRMEVIELTGYTAEEKLEIAKRYLVPRQIKANGLTTEQVQISDDAVRLIIDEYTREAGCRNLERQIGASLRSAAVKIAAGEATQVSLGPQDIPTILGPRRFENELAMRTSVPGVATGLAWTPVGGDILFIESSRVPGSGKLILTGQLGDVMKESAQTAVTLVKALASQLGFGTEGLDKQDLHIHVPAGAIPKDGPSAGVAMFMSLASLLANRTVRSDVAMTGEISLRGLVLPVGGIKEKVIAAARAGIRCVILPARNRKDFEDVPESVRQELKFVWAERVEDALAAALDQPPAEVARARAARASATGDEGARVAH